MHALGRKLSQSTNFTANFTFKMPRRPFEAPTKVRFATYCLLSLLSVAIFQFTTSDDINCAMQQLLCLASPCIVMIGAYMINNHINKHPTTYMDSCLHPLYTAPLSAVLVFLGQLAIWTRVHLTIPPTDIGNDPYIQECAIHFAMSFYVLSECEYHRLYWTTHRHGIAFEQSRDCVSYHFAMPIFEYLPSDSWLSRDTLMRHVVDVFVLYIPFYMVGLVYIGYPIKRLVNPDLDDGELHLKVGLLTLFNPTNFFSNILVLQLQRPMRLLNRILFWSIVDCIQGVWKRRETTVLP
jgi:hypothetical protein